MLTPGSRLGNYEAVALIGVGGMGEVFRARDTRLRRDVALKVLPPQFASDPDRLARFQREAQVLASLNHPNIAAIYGIEEDDHQRALVMELVDGETLAERIARGPLPMAEMLPMARQIAEALETAHEQGVVHRDLKPANIKVRPDGMGSGCWTCRATSSISSPRSPDSKISRAGHPIAAGSCFRRTAPAPAIWS
jgi:eukaryotic-like serine/threonine-protein kinase